MGVCGDRATLAFIELIHCCRENADAARHLVPIDVRPHLSSALAAGLADELGLNIGKPNMISPSIAADSE
jgi:hypothetical protein